LERRNAASILDMRLVFGFESGKRLFRTLFSGLGTGNIDIFTFSAASANMVTTSGWTSAMPPATANNSLLASSDGS
jgi:hypothetical protein